MSSARKSNAERGDVPASSETGSADMPGKLKVQWIDDDTVRVHTRVESFEVDEPIARSVVFGEVHREEPDEEDDGEVHELADGSISIPVLEEQIVVTKRTVVRERIVVRKRTESEVVRIRDQVHREEIHVEADETYEIRRTPGRTRPLPLSSADPNRKATEHGG